MIICQEQHPSQPPGRSGKPAANLDAPRRQGCIERRGVLMHTSPGGSIVRQYQEPRHAAHEPASLTCDLGREPGLAVENAKHRLEVRHDRLDLDDEERPGRWVEREDVDGAALAADVERHLGGDLPPHRPETAQHPLREVGVSAVEQPIEAFALPQQSHGHRPAERRRHADQDVQGDAIGATALDATNDTPRHVRRTGETLLRPATSTAQRSHPESESHDIHGRECVEPRSPGAYRQTGGGQPTKRSTPGASAPATSTITYAARSSRPATRCSWTLTPMIAIRP
jgi:hypothetical protein